MRAHLLLCAWLTSGCFSEFGDFTPGGGGPAGGDGGSDVDVPSGSGAAGGGPQGGAPPELCGGAGDEDGDGLVDCQDPDCGGYLCVPSLPGDGWTGPLLVVGPEDECGGAFPDPGPSGQTVGDNPCACECASAAIPSDCTATVTPFGTSTCTSAGAPIVVGPSATCAAAAATADAVSVSHTFVGGTCTPSFSSSASFGEIRTCSAESSGGCADGETCVRPGPPGSLVCFAQAGLATCGAPFSDRVVMLEAPAEATGCSNADCACGTAVGGSCSGAVTLDDQSCGSTGNQVTVPSPSACHDLAGTASIGSVRFTGQAAGGSCPIEVLTDVERFGDATTLCCTTSL